MFFSQPKTLLTVPQVLTVGQWRVLYAPFIFIFFGFQTMRIVGRHYDVWQFCSCLLGIVGIGMLYWSIAVGRWRVF